MHHAKHPPRFAILGSGRGSNAEALMQAFARGRYPASLELVASNSSHAPILAKASGRGYKTLCIPHRGLTRQRHEELLIDGLQAIGIDHIILAGYMRVLSPFFLSQFSGSILNIHPSLLPAFPGIDAPGQQIRAGVSRAGATVHLVTTEVDAGPILIQESLKVHPDDTAASLAQRIRTEIEHQLYPQAITIFLERLRNAPALLLPTTNTPAAAAQAVA